MNRPRSIASVGAFALAVVFTLTVARGQPAGDPTPRFEAANLLYEKGQFVPAAHAYEALLDAGVQSSALLFNAGNAWFKAGETGRAVSYWLRAEALDPRNDRIQVNLEFVRKQVNGGVLPDARWPAPLRRWTPGEWSAAVLAAGALCFGLLTVLTLRPAWRPWLRLPATVSGLALGLLLVLLAITSQDRANLLVAVVITDEAVIRRGPLAESPSVLVARDGTECTVLDSKDGWLRVADPLGREGWLLGKQVVVLRAGHVVEGDGTKLAEPFRAHGSAAPAVVAGPLDG